MDLHPRQAMGQLHDLLKLLGAESFEQGRAAIIALQYRTQYTVVTQPNGKPLPATCAISGCHYDQYDFARGQLVALTTLRADPHTTREIVQDHANGGRRFGHNPSWIKVATVLAFAQATLDQPPTQAPPLNIDP